MERFATWQQGNERHYQWGTEQGAREDALEEVQMGNGPVLVYKLIAIYKKPDHPQIEVVEVR